MPRDDRLTESARFRAESRDSYNTEDCEFHLGEDYEELTDSIGFILRVVSPMGSRDYTYWTLEAIPKGVFDSEVGETWMSVSQKNRDSIPSNISFDLESVTVLARYFSDSTFAYVDPMRVAPANYSSGSPISTWSSPIPGNVATLWIQIQIASENRKLNMVETVIDFAREWVKTIYE